MEDPSATRPYYRLIGLKTGQPTPPGQSELLIESRPELGNSRGDIHGGVIASVLDAAIGVAVRSALPNSAATTASLTVNYVRPGQGNLVAHAKVVRAGKSLASAEAFVTNGDGEVVAHAVATMRVLKGS